MFLLMFTLMFTPSVSIEAEEAVEMIMIGSHLLKIVDSRKANKGS